MNEDWGVLLNAMDSQRFQEETTNHHNNKESDHEDSNNRSFGSKIRF